MSDALIVRRGGGGGLSPSKAVLHILAPSGATITLVKGGVTVATLGPGKSHVNAADANFADWFYAIGSSSYGDWTVEAEKNGATVSRTIRIDAAKTYDLTLYFGRLYWEGDENVGVTGGWVPKAGYWESGYNYPQGGPYIVRNDSSIFFRTHASGNNNGATATLSTANKIDLTNYSTLNIQTTNTKGYSIAGSEARIFSAVSQNEGKISDYAAAYSAIRNSTDPQTTSVDVSEVSGEYFVCLTIWNRNNYAAEVTFNRIWLE